jgi:murein DD-endopeptidase MepM/ murein hydrolase activator NlpD
MAGSRNIIGESFKKYVRDQVKTRQEKLGRQDRDTDLLKYISNKTSWIRLSSGVDIDYNKATEYTALGAQYFHGNLLAKKSVLFSTRKYQSYPIDLESKSPWIGEFTQGVGYDLPNPSYGYTPGIGMAGKDINSDDKYDYGMVPPAGITSIEIKSRNRGSLRDAVVQISCHSLAQFRIIEALYLKLKYSMLLEWGHTYWYNNKGDLRTDMPDDVHRKFLNGGYDQDSLLEDLEKRREAYCGNYDAFLGWVTNFDWNLRKDGGYDITLNLISFGDVIESLKMNMNYPTSNTVNPTEDEQKNKNKPAVIANKNKSTIHQILYAIKKELDYQGYLDGFNSGGKSSLSSGEIVRMTKANSGYDLINYNYKDPNEIWDTANNILTYQEGMRAYFYSLRTNDDGDATGGSLYYIKLGTLLRIIESFLLKYDTSKGSTGNYKPLFYIDHDYDKNLCLTLPRQTSVDPKICLLKAADNTFINKINSTSKASAVVKYNKLVYNKNSESTYGPGGGGISYYYQVTKTEGVTADDPEFSADKVVNNEPNVAATSATPNKIVYFLSIDSYSTSDTVLAESGLEDSTNTTSGLGDYFRVEQDGVAYPFLGRLMHILINLDFISTTLENNIDDKGNVSIYKFLQQLMKGIQQAIGNMNDFDITYDESTNYYIIRDLSILPDAEKLLKREVEVTKFNANILKNNFGSFVTDVSIKSTLNNSFASTIAIGAQVNGNKIGENSTALSRLNNGYVDRLIKDRSSLSDKNTEEGEGKSKNPEDVYAQNLTIFKDLKDKINQGSVTVDDISNNTQAIVDIYKYELGYYTEQGNIPGVGFIPIDLQLTMDGLSGPRIYEVYNINEELLPESYKNNVQFITIGVSHKVDGNGWSTTLNSLSGPKKSSLKPLSNISIDTNNSSAPKPESTTSSAPPPAANETIKGTRTYRTNTVNNQYYGANRDGGSRKHAGVDIDITGPDAEMVSFIGGVVIKIGEQVDEYGRPKGYGKYVDIYNESLGVVERIAEANSINVLLGQTVKKGQVVSVGESKTGVIHYEIRYKNQYDSDKGKGAFGYATSTSPLDYLVSKGIVSLDDTPGYTKIIFNA